MSNMNKEKNIKRSNENIHTSQNANKNLQITNIPSTPQKIRSYSPKVRARSNFDKSR